MRPAAKVGAIARRMTAAAQDTSLRVTAVAAPVRRQAAMMLRKAITSGRFVPGQRLVERDLCELLGVSRPSVREALRELESDGLIDIIPNRGPLVKHLTVADAVSVYQVRGALEALAARLFVENATDEQVASLVITMDLLADSYRSLDVERILAAKRDFYTILLDGSGNLVIQSLLRSLNDRVNLLRRLTLTSPRRARQSLREIRGLVNAIRRRDAEAAADLAMHHIQQAAKVAIRALEDASR